MLNDQSYPKNKTGYPFFWTTLYIHLLGHVTLYDHLYRVVYALPVSHRPSSLWGVYTIQQTSSKLPANVFKIHVNCWTFAGSRKHPIMYSSPFLTKLKSNAARIE